jgi:hypothetical protein
MGYAERTGDAVTVAYRVAGDTVTTRPKVSHNVYLPAGTVLHTSQAWRHEARGLARGSSAGSTDQTHERGRYSSGDRCPEIVRGTIVDKSDVAGALTAFVAPHARTRATGCRVAAQVARVFRKTDRGRCRRVTSDRARRDRAVLHASLELHGLGRSRINSAIELLLWARMITVERFKVDFGCSQDISRWRLASPESLGKAYPLIGQEALEWIDRQEGLVLSARPFVSHDGITNVGGEGSVQRALEAARDDGHIRCFAYHGLSSFLDGAIRQLADEGARIRLRALLVAEDADEKEGAPPDDHVAAVRAGMQKINELKAAMQKSPTGHIRIEVRR